MGTPTIPAWVISQWNATIKYTRNNIVFYQGNYYATTNDLNSTTNTTGIPPNVWVKTTSAINNYNSSVNYIANNQVKFTSSQSGSTQDFYMVNSSFTGIVKNIAPTTWIQVAQNSEFLPINTPQW